MAKKTRKIRRNAFTCRYCGRLNIPVELCAQCRKNIDCIAVQVSHYYGSADDGKRLVFCSDKCYTKYFRPKTKPISGNIG